MLGCPIRKSADQNVCAIPRSLSQLITSFIASVSLGIRRTPLITSLEIFLLSCILSQYVNELYPVWVCGEYRSRTDDLLLAKQAL